MVVDSSVVIAVLRDENDASDWEAKLVGSARLVLSVANYVGIVMVLVGRQREPQLDGLERFMLDAEIQIEPMTEQDALLARDAFLRYGKGRHRARLNFGDCFSYALAQRLREPLLFKGNDFIFTDVLKA